MKSIKVNPLSQSSIKQAIKDLEKYRQLLKEFPDKYTKALSQFLYESLRANAPYMFDHWIMDIREKENGCEGVFIFDGIVQFVEFGSGVIGESFHDGINDEWLSKLPPPYNTGYGSNAGGIGHYLDKNGVDYWVYPKNGQYYSTYGQRANPFIYTSVQELLQARKDIAKYLLNDGDNYGI